MSRRGENIRKRKDGRWEGRYYMLEPQSGRNMIRVFNTCQLNNIAESA